MPFGAKIVGPTTMYNMDGEAVEQSGELPVLVLGRLLAEDGTWWYVVNTNTYRNPNWRIVPQEAVQFYTEARGVRSDLFQQKMHPFVPVIARLNSGEPIYVRYPFEGDNTPRFIDRAVGGEVVRLLFKASHASNNVSLYQAVYNRQVVWISTDGVPEAYVPSDLYALRILRYNTVVEIRSQPIANPSCRSALSTDFPVAVYASSVYQANNDDFYGFFLYEHQSRTVQLLGWHLVSQETVLNTQTVSQYDELGYERYVLFPAPFRGYLSRSPQDLANVP
ncbi:MAG: hypothetical protein CUN55_16390, partial [Phototrophicales bacterium]